MAASTNRRNRIGEFIARLFDRPSTGRAPGQLYGHGPSGMNQQPRIRWSDNSASLIGSARYIQEKLVAYQTRGVGRQSAGRTAGQSEPASSAGGDAKTDPRQTDEPTPGLRSPRSAWADKWQR